MSNRIILKGNLSRHEEYPAAAAILPGQLVQLTSDGKVTPHSTAGGIAERLIALEDALQGKTIDDAYAIGDIVAIGVLLPGDEVNLRLEAGQSITAAGKLSSNGNGNFKAFATVALAVALETLDNDDSLNESVLIKSRIL